MRWPPRVFQARSRIGRGELLVRWRSERVGRQGRAGREPGRGATPTSARGGGGRNRGALSLPQLRCRNNAGGPSSPAVSQSSLKRLNVWLSSGNVMTSAHHHRRGEPRILTSTAPRKAL